MDTKGVIEGYRERYESLIKSHKFSHMEYCVTPRNRIMVHIKVPSETVDDFQYDVLLELTGDKTVSDFRDCDIQVFSNCPSFVYTYAYIFAHWDPDAGRMTGKGKGMMIDAFKSKLPRDRMLVPGAETKLGRKPIHDEPVTRNPMGIPLFDKSIYFAIFYMLDELSFGAVMNNHNNVSLSRVLSAVETFESLMHRRAAMEKRQSVAKKDKEKDLRSDFERQESNLNKRNKTTFRHPSHVLSPHTTKGNMKASRTASKPKSPRHIG